VAAATELARWLADSAEIGWLTSGPTDPRAGRVTVGSPVDTAVDRDGSLLFSVPTSEPRSSALVAAPTAYLLLTEPAMGGLEPRETAQLAMHGRAQPVSPAESSWARRLAQRAQAVGRDRPLLFRLAGAAATYAPRSASGLPRVTFAADAWQRARPGVLPAALGALVDHLNSEHAELLRDLYAAHTGRPGAQTVVVTGLRPQELILTAMSVSGVDNATLAFRRPVITPAEVAAELLRLLGRIGWGHCTRTLQACNRPPAAPPQL